MHPALTLVLATCIACSKPTAEQLPSNTDAPKDTTAEQIARDYAAGNEIAADKKYKGRALHVRATVIGVARDEDGVAMGVLEGGGTKETWVMARFKSDDDAGSLRRGELAELLCVGNGITPAGHPRLRDCTVVRQSPASGVIRAVGEVVPDTRERTPASSR